MNILYSELHLQEQGLRILFTCYLQEVELRIQYVCVDQRESVELWNTIAHPELYSFYLQQHMNTVP